MSAAAVGTQPAVRAWLHAPRAALADEIVVDSFAGGGGASKGIEMALGRSPDIAINHDEEAIALHAANHPDSEHYQENVWKVDPREATRGRPVGLMWLSPDCKYFSKAKGGKPVSRRVRGLAWVAVRWAVAVRPRVIVLENVEEFQGWGPLLENGRPCPRRRGVHFRRFVGRLRNLGHAVEWRELRACDYGAPTSRKRLFLIARCDGRLIVWPKPTHGPDRALPWRTAAQVIDWSIPCPSIFITKKQAKALGLGVVKRPLVEATRRRIARGVWRYVINAPTPFIVGLGGRMGQSPERAVDRPHQTITAKNDAALVTPYLVEYHAAKRDGDDRTQPLPASLPTQTTENRFGLVAPVLVPRYGEREGQEPRAIPVDRPMPTVVPTQNGAQLVAAFMAQHNTDVVGHAMGEPVSTIVGKGCTQGLVAAHIAKHYGGRVGSQLDLPLHTVTAASVHHALVTSHLQRDFGASVGSATDAPVPAITAGGGGHVAEVRAFLVAYYGSEKDGGRLVDPVRTLSTRDRFGLVTVEGQDYVIVDIGMRMLAPRELYRAQGFPDSYRIDIRFKGKRLSKTAQVKMCGNSVCPPLAAAIVAANVGAETLEAVA